MQEAYPHIYGHPFSSERHPPETAKHYQKNEPYFTKLTLGSQPYMNNKTGAGDTQVPKQRGKPMRMRS